MTDPPRDWVVPASPSLRRKVTRATVRVLVLDEDGRILLFEDSDPGVGVRWWETPGGGIDPGEAELAEETGQTVAAEQVIGPLARRHVVHGYSDLVVSQHDTFYAVRTRAFEVDTAGHTEEEQVTLLGSRWWTADEIAVSTEEFWPALLLDLVALLDVPTSWPVELEDVEESTVPV